MRTARLRLEPWSDAHTPMLARLAAMPEVARYIRDGRPWSAAEAAEASARHVAHWREHGFGWRAALLEDAPVGLMALTFLGDGAAGLDPSEYEIGWWLDPAVWGRGLAREGAAALRDEAFGRLGAPSIVARIQPANAPSRAVAAAIGMTLDGETTGRLGEPVLVYRLNGS